MPWMNIDCCVTTVYVQPLRQICVIYPRVRQELTDFLMDGYHDTPVNTKIKLLIF
jgi:hypothetical protein